MHHRPLARKGMSTPSVVPGLAWTSWIRTSPNRFPAHFCALHGARGLLLTQNRVQQAVPSPTLVTLPSNSQVLGGGVQSLPVPLSPRETGCKGHVLGGTSN
jgi:hypothetical protein